MTNNLTELEQLILDWSRDVYINTDQPEVRDVMERVIVRVLRGEVRDC